RVCFAPHQYHRALPAFPTRRSSDLHQPQGHADVDQDVAENHRQHARHDEASHAVLGLEQDTAAPPKNDTEQEQHKDAAHKTKLLADHRKYEVRVPGRQEVELRLGASEQALAKQAAGADGDHGLDDVPAFVVPVSVRIKEHD